MNDIGQKKAKIAPSKSSLQKLNSQFLTAYKYILKGGFVYKLLSSSLNGIWKHISVVNVNKCFKKHSIKTRSLLITQLRSSVHRK